jgi:hypothetical protein
VAFVRSIAVALVLLFVVPAQGKDETRAAQLRDEAIGFFKAGDHRKALSSFLKAYSYVQQPMLLQNIARCYEELGEAESAVKYFERFLEAGPSKALRKDTRARLTRLREFLARRGVLAVVGGMAGTTISLDGRLLGKTPLEPFSLKPGRRELLIGPPGLAFRELTVEVRAGETTRLDLDQLLREATKARLRILGTAPGDLLSIDGAAPKAVPLGPIELAPGEHHVVVTRKGFAPFTASLGLKPAQEHSLTVAFQSNGAGRAGAGPWPWVVGGVGLAVAAGGIGFTVQANSEHEAARKFNAQGDGAGQQAAEDARDKNDAVAIAMYSIGGAMVITSVVLFFVMRPAEPASQAMPSLMPLRGGALVGARIPW